MSRIDRPLRRFCPLEWIKGRKSPVKAVGVAVREASTDDPIRPKRRFPLLVPVHRTSPQEFAMADLAFVIATIAGFALVALVAKGVTKL
ncbi:hypothetical protein IOD14_20620 [Streptomyces sp. A2-16]|uniref:hypothetical protein n=1 Tax=Streptomyces sp. A2-16 TaxID=2781734 RepID=UPI001BAFB685|nr:hypothetical protein [Streptomyces sp. A2-16]QUC63789.1 hypothetical protein IOD14_20620 [Streptomyces sp. A2-16]